MNKILFIIFVLGLLAFPFIRSGQGEKISRGNKLIVGSAASLKDAMTELREKFCQDNTDIQIELTFAATGTIRSQIENGAPIDVFASANPTFGCKTEDYATIVDSKSVSNMCFNSMVLIQNKKYELKDKNLFPSLNFKNVNKIAIGNPDYVPAGKYAKKLLVSRSLWENNSEFVYANNVRQVLGWVEQGIVPAGFVYRTDALHSDKVKIVAEFAVINGKKITYPIAINKNTGNTGNAQVFIEFVLSADGQKILAKHGFVTQK